jgi:hypothetical protein
VEVDKREELIAQELWVPAKFAAFRREQIARETQKRK